MSKKTKTDNDKDSAARLREFAFCYGNARPDDLNLLADIVAVDGGICAIVRPQSSGEAACSCRRHDGWSWVGSVAVDLGGV